MFIRECDILIKKLLNIIFVIFMDNIDFLREEEIIIIMKVIKIKIVLKKSLN